MQRQDPPNLRVDPMFPIGVAGAKPPGFDARGEAYAAAFEQAAIGMALVDLAGQLLSVNRALCQILGYERQELLSLRFDAILDPRDAKLDFEPIRQLLKGEVDHFHTEKRYVHKQGHCAVGPGERVPGARPGQPTLLLHCPVAGYHRSQAGRIHVSRSAGIGARCDGHRQSARPDHAGQRTTENNLRLRR